MAGLNEIIALCKSGQVTDAYNQAKADLEQGMPWAKLTTGKALYYCIRKDAEEGRYEELIVHLDELMALCIEEAKKFIPLEKGDNIIVTGGLVAGKIGFTNLMKIETI